VSEEILTSYQVIPRRLRAVVLMTGIEPATSSLPRKCSTD
jgi:hypothetical protein